MGPSTAAATSRLECVLPGARSVRRIVGCSDRERRAVCRRGPVVHAALELHAGPINAAKASTGYQRRCGVSSGFLCGYGNTNAAQIVGSVEDALQMISTGLPSRRPLPFARGGRWSLVW